MQRLHLYDDTVREMIDEHDLDDPASCVYPLGYYGPTHYLLTAAEYALLLAGETPS